MLGDSGEKDGNEVSDLSESAADDAELQAREALRGLARRVDERYDLTDVVLFWETERSRDGAADDGGTMAGCLGGGGGHRVAWFGGLVDAGGWESMMPLGLAKSWWLGWAEACRRRSWDKAAAEVWQPGRIRWA